MATLERTWRWFGPDDPIPLQHVRQAGAVGVVTALHEIENGAVWPRPAIAARRHEIDGAGLRWSVVESLPVHEEIKTRGAHCAEYIERYCESLENLAACGVDTVCFNLMPAVDWTRTHLDVTDETGAQYLRFDMIDFAAFDIHFLERSGAAADYGEAVRQGARARADAMDDESWAKLERSILLGLPGTVKDWTLAEFRGVLDTYREIDDATYRGHVIAFLRAVVPIAERLGMRLALHPDDPPFPLFGLPRVISTEADVRQLFDAIPSSTLGITLCVGSFGARPDNDIVRMIDRFGPRLHFAHLRNVRREPDGSFIETHHLEGDLDMPAMMRALLRECRRRRGRGEHGRLPWRPDHGHLMFDDAEQGSYPGYSAVGRLKGLSELRGLEAGLTR